MPVLDLIQEAGSSISFTLSTPSSGLHHGRTYSGTRAPKSMRGAAALMPFAGACQ